MDAREKRELLNWGSDLSRRDFLAKASAAGAGFFLAPALFGQGTGGAAADELRVAIIGCGSQGLNLINNCLKIPGIRFVAVCDIWEFSRGYAERLLKKYDQQVNAYIDYQDMLAKETDLDGVIVASPDWVHAEHANACMRAGIHVYCEKEMSNDLGQAAEIVKTQRDTGVLCQIGHQRRSNPRYWHALKLIEKDKVLGRITNFEGQWNRGVRDDIGWPKKYEMPADLLAKYGYENMHQFRNWRWYKKYGGGPISDLGSHQVDVFNWFLKTPPKAVLANGGLDYYEDRDWPDTVLSIYHYETADGPVRGFYQVLNTTSHGGFYETFMGDEGSLVISEDERKGHFFKEPGAKTRDWEEQSETVTKDGAEAYELKIGETLAPDGGKDPEALKLLEEAQKPVHQLHLENFFNAVRGAVALTCPPEIGYETAVAILRVNEAIANGGRLDFKPEEFRVA